ncbi:hypothetical protein [Methylobacter sp. YRD-M1]|uniref:hypothetical protein n=1 Tax=Methylobacter sp. YRD-M1 TaxID=2911520 RepID=UPI00227D647C|nr:hypothetical protein [Methylobacter sp. YRD-M1]WAK03272.1 hypothetical protein LZ558_05670 [Methylobacter sp. YRD-M1]
MDKRQNDLESSQPAVGVKELGMVLQSGGSKKLAEIRRKVQTNLPPVEPANADHEISAGLKPEVAAELKKARKLIDERIAAIMGRFPTGKQNKMFSFRYGSVDAIKRMDMNAAFKRLGMPDNQVRMRLIAGLDYYGNVAGAGEIKPDSPTAG